jgi:hypothetical protein
VTIGGARKPKHVGVAITAAGGVWVRVLPPMTGATGGRTYNAADWVDTLREMAAAVEGGRLAVARPSAAAARAALQLANK